MTATRILGYSSSRICFAAIAELYDPDNLAVIVKQIISFPSFAIVSKTSK